MQKTYLRIEHVGAEHLFDELLKSSAFFFVFITGVAIGFLISLVLTSSFHLSSVHPNQLVGAAALSDVYAADTEDDTVKNIPRIVQQTPYSSISTEVTSRVSAPVQTLQTQRDTSLSHERSVRDVRLLVIDKQIVIDRINQELERVKNSSVALVAQFDQNCGSWSDTCAEPYSKTLDASNALYADLSAALTIAQRDLHDANTALNEALSSN